MILSSRPPSLEELRHYVAAGTKLGKSRDETMEAVRAGWCPACKLRFGDCECRDRGTLYRDPQELDFG